LEITEIMLSEFGTYALTTLDQWVSVLHLASKWGFESIRSLALRELLPLASPVDKIVLGRKYGFDGWLTPAFVAVCARAEPLSLAEADKMSNADVTRIFQARERARLSSAAVDSATAQEAIACIFGSGQQPIAAADSDMDDHVAGPTSDTRNPDMQVECASPVKAPLQTEPLSQSSSVVEVDDSLMDALANVTRLYAFFQNSGIHASPFTWHANYLNSESYRNYKTDYEGLLAYVGGPQLQTASLSRLLAIILQNERNSRRPGLCAQLCKDFRIRMDEGSRDVDDGSKNAQLRGTVFDCILHEQCLELARYDCALDGNENSYHHRNRSADLVTRLTNADLLNETTLCAYFSCVISTLPGHPDVALLKNWCAFLTSHGKMLDRESCRHLMDDVFAKLRKHATEYKYQSARKSIIVSVSSTSRRAGANFNCLRTWMSSVARDGRLNV
jgi:hypothetical protein